LTKEEFKYAYDKYFDSVRNYLYYKSGDPELATDIAQETFIRIWEKQFDIEPKKIKSLLYKISENMLFDHFRKEKVKNKHLKEVRLNFEYNDFYNNMEYNEMLKAYEVALTNLPEKQRIVFLMNRLEGLTYNEISKRLQISIKAVEKRMSKALAKLRSMIKNR